jgi:U3 small nucleolar RNA-associated protein 4
MLWIEDTLVTAGLSGRLDQWDLVSLKPSHSLNCEGGPVWCIAENPTLPEQLAVGSDDGVVRVFSISHSGFEFICALHRQETRVLCLAWHNSGDYIAMGGTDSVVRIIHVSSATCKSRITLDDYKEKSTILWDAKFVNDSIVTGDSVGKVQIWDFKTGSLQNTFNQHSADVLTLAVQVKESTIFLFASGVDSLIMKITFVQPDADETCTGGKWIPSGKLRPHEHDVSSLHLSHTGMLASGGVEGDLAISNAYSFNKSSSVKYEQFPCTTRYIKLTKGGELLLFQGISTLSLWRISHVNDAGVTEKRSKALSHALTVGKDLSFGKNKPLLLLNLKSKPPHNILSSAISCDGCEIAISTVFEMWIYKFSEQKCELLLVGTFPCPSCSMLFVRNQHKLFFKHNRRIEKCCF